MSGRSHHPVGRLLLLLYPGRFRRDFGDEAIEVLSEDLHETRSLGRMRGSFRYLRLCADFAIQGVAERISGVFGGTERTKVDLTSGWLGDLRVAIRGAAKRPAFVIVAVTSLAIGVGANTIVFAVADTILFREIPGVQEPDRILELHTVSAEGRLESWDFPSFLDVRREIDRLSAVALFETGPVTLSDDRSGERLMAMYLTSGYFEALGVPLALGRPFTPDEDSGPGAHRVVVLSDATWRSRFEADPEILGRTVRLNREPYTVIGVAPPEFTGHEIGIQPSVFVPITQYPPVMRDPDRFLGSRGTTWGSVVARLEPGVEVEAVNASIASLFSGLAETGPEYMRARSARATVASRAPGEDTAVVGIAFGLIGALMLLVLGATCANVGGMLLARASAQERDMAVRLALGAGRARLVRLLLFEALLIFTLGGAGGILLAVEGLSLLDLNRLVPSPYPIAFTVMIDWRVVAFGLGLTLGTGLLFGLLPALQVTRGGIIGALRDHAAGNTLRAGRLRRVFVGGQVGISMVLLGSAALLLSSTRNNARLDPGFAPEGVYLTSLDLALEGYEDATAANEFVDRGVTRLRAHPAITNATVASDFPLDGSSSSTPVWPDGRGEAEEGWIQSYYAKVTAGYFETLGVEVLAGRPFSATDGRLTERVAIVNELYANIAWPDDNPIGRTVEFGLDPQVYTVVGVVRDTQTDMVTDQPSPHVFSLLSQDFVPSVDIAVRGANPGDDFPAIVRAEILSVDPALGLGLTRSLGDLAGLGMLPQRISAAVAIVLGGLALFLAAIGVYGIVAFTVAQRTREIGVRIALGASRKQVVMRVVRGGLLLAIPGYFVGILLAVALGHVFRAAFVGVRPLDPLAYGPVTLVILLAVLAASVFPARKASSIDPMDALRYD